MNRETRFIFFLFRFFFAFPCSGLLVDSVLFFGCHPGRRQLDRPRPRGATPGPPLNAGRNEVPAQKRDRKEKREKRRVTGPLKEE